MTNKMSRRQFIKCCGATAVIMTAVTPGQVRAANTINFWMHGFDEENFGEETLLMKAMNLVAARLQDRRIVQNVYDVRPSRYFITGDVMKNSNLIDNDRNRRNLLWHQLNILSQPNDPDDTEPAFPPPAGSIRSGPTTSIRRWPACRPAPRRRRAGSPAPRPCSVSPRPTSSRPSPARPLRSSCSSPGTTGRPSSPQRCPPRPAPGRTAKN